MNMLKKVFCGLSFGLLMMTSSFAVELRGTANVSITSDTAATAKNMAFDEARRQIIVDTLRQYADIGALTGAVANAKNSELMELISSSSIGGEQLSDTTYSASITMVLDAELARKWLDDNNVQNWVPDGTSVDTFVVLVEMSNPIANWADLNRIVRAEKIDLGTQQLSGNTARLELPVSARGGFTIAVRESGWRFANQDGALRIWK